jgi:GT2 family glycosyltransferase
MSHMMNGRSALASVIVPFCNQLEFTRHCITALLCHTRQPWELIVIDNGSTDGTRDNWPACRMLVIGGHHT